MRLTPDGAPVPLRPDGVPARLRDADAWRMQLPNGDVWPSNPPRVLSTRLTPVAPSPHAWPQDGEYGRMQSWVLPPDSTEDTAPDGHTVATSVSPQGIPPFWQGPLARIPHRLTYALDDLALASVSCMALSGPDGAAECARLFRRPSVVA